MPDPAPIWEGDEWERHCLRLLRLRYGDDLQEIPSDRSGDLGIEAFSRTDGRLFQCYAPLEPLDTRKRHAAQKKKLSQDLDKLRQNAGELAALLGQVRVRRYVFLVPVFDGPELPTHATEAAAEVRGWGLPFVAADFDVVVVTDDAYLEERARLIQLGQELADVEIPDIEPARVAAWSEAHEPWVENL